MAIFISILIIFVVLLFFETYFLHKNFNKKKLKYNTAISINHIKYLIKEENFIEMKKYTEQFFNKNFDDIEDLISVIEILLNTYKDINKYLIDHHHVKDINRKKENKKILLDFISNLTKYAFKVNPYNPEVLELTLQYYKISKDPNYNDFIANNFTKSPILFKEYIQYLILNNENIKAKNIITEYKQNTYLVTSEINDLLNNLGNNEDVILQEIKDNPYDIDLLKKYINQFLLPQKRLTEVVKYVINIFNISDSFDTDMFNILLNILQKDEHMYDNININDLSHVFEKAMHAMPNNILIQAEYIGILVKKGEYNGLINFFNKYDKEIYSNNILLEKMIKILMINKDMVKQINYNKLAEFLLSKFESNTNTEEDIVFLVYLANSSLLNQDQIYKLSLIIGDNIDIAIHDPNITQVYIKTLMNNNDFIKLYDFYIKVIKNKNVPNKEHIIDDFLSLFDKIKLSNPNIINYDDLIPVAESIVNDFSNNNTYIDFYLNILSNSSNTKKLYEILYDKIISTNFTSITFIQKYIELITKNEDMLNLCEKDFLTKIKESYNINNFEHDVYFDILENILSYKNNNIKEFYETTYNLISNRNIIDQNMLNLFANIFESDKNAQDNISFNKAMFIIDKALENLSEKTYIIRAKIKALMVYKNNKEAIDYIVNVIVEENFKVDISIYKKFIEVLKLLDNVEIQPSDIDSYLNIFKHISDYLKNDEVLMKVYLQFLESSNLYEYMKNYCDNMLKDPDISEGIRSDVALYYIKAIYHICKSIFDEDKDNLFNKEKVEKMIVHLKEMLSTFIIKNITNSPLVSEYAKLLQLNGEYKEAKNILNTALNDKLSSDIFLIQSTILDIMKDLNEPSSNLEELARKMILANPYKPNGYIQLAKILYNTLSPDKITEADNLIKKAYNLDKDNLDLIDYYTHILAKEKKFDEAIKIIEEKTKIYPHNKNLMKLYFDVYKQKEEYKKSNKN